MKNTYLPSLFFISALLLLGTVAIALGQTRDKFVISAKAGGVNAVTGQASVHSKGETEWQQLTVTDDLNAGDRVRTANDGRVEILLNPGSYLRIGGNSELELSDNSLSNLELRILRGTAIVEATGLAGADISINISTPHARLAIVREGLYRLNVVPGDGTELIVRKGRVILNDSHTKVKGGNKVIFNATSTAVAKLTKEEKKKSIEDIELWSRDRSQTLAKANSRITNRMLASAFNESRDWTSFQYGTRNGFWFYSPPLGCYTFLPLYFATGTPYGSTYQTVMYIGPYPNRVPGTTYSQPVVGTGVANPSSSSVPGMPGLPSAQTATPAGRSAPPVSSPSAAPEINRATHKIESMTEPGRPN